MEVIKHPNGKIEIIPSSRIVRKKAWKEAVARAGEAFGTVFDPKHIQHSLLRRRAAPDYEGPLIELTLPDGQVIKRVPRTEAQTRALEDLIETGRRLEAELESVPLPEPVAGIARIESGEGGIEGGISVIPDPGFFDQKFHDVLKRAGFVWVSGKRFWQGPDTDEARLALKRALQRLEERQQKAAEDQAATRKMLAEKIKQLAGSWEAEGYRLKVMPIGTRVEIQAPKGFGLMISQAGGKRIGNDIWTMEASSQQDIDRIRKLISDLKSRLLDFGKKLRSCRDKAKALAGDYGGPGFPIRVAVENDIIRIRSPYDENAVALIRQARAEMGAGRWNRYLKSWEFPVTEVQRVEKLIRDLDAFSREKPVRSDEKPQDEERQRWLFGPRKDSWKCGDMVVDDNARKIEGVVNRIIAVDDLGIDCMSFGGGPDDRYRFIVTLREPTPQEREQVESRWREMDRQAAVRRLAREISNYITKHGEYVSSWRWDDLMRAHKDGEILWQQTDLELYGTADWLIRHDGRLIVDQRRHADGDTWAANNVGETDRVWVIDENKVPEEIRGKIAQLRELQREAPEDEAPDEAPDDGDIPDPPGPGL